MCDLAVEKFARIRCVCALQVRIAIFGKTTPNYHTPLRSNKKLRLLVWPLSRSCFYISSGFCACQWFLERACLTHLCRRSFGEAADILQICTNSVFFSLWFLAEPVWARKKWLNTNSMRNSCPMMTVSTINVLINMYIFFFYFVFNKSNNINYLNSQLRFLNSVEDIFLRNTFL